MSPDSVTHYRIEVTSESSCLRRSDPFDVLVPVPMDFHHPIHEGRSRGLYSLTHSDLLSSTSLVGKRVRVYGLTVVRVDLEVKMWSPWRSIPTVSY